MNEQSIAPEPSAHLSEKSKCPWRAIAGKRAKSAGRLVAVLTALEALDRADQRRERIDRDGLTTTTTTTGALHCHPLQKVEKDARGLFARIWDQLGLTHLLP